jgi:hypothetical protein
MSDGLLLQVAILPPPAGTILLYAADGLSTWRGHFNPSGRPRTPERSLWVPMFRQLVDSPEGLTTLHSMAEAGMRAWDCSEDVLACLPQAFRDITFRALSIAALEDFAATAREKVSLHGTDRTRSVQATPSTSQRQQPNTPSTVSAPTVPRRPGSRRRGRTPTPN